MPIRLCCCALLWLAASGNAQAALLLSFSHTQAAWYATDIVVVREADILRGQFDVIAVWKGHLGPGDRIVVPELARLAPASAREIGGFSWPGEEKQKAYVTNSRLVLFLKRLPVATPSLPTKSERVDLGVTENPARISWVPAWGDDFQISVAWIERGHAHGFRQICNPGPLVLVPLGWQPELTEKRMKEDVTEVVRQQRELEAALRLPDPAGRAQALTPFINAWVSDARQRAFDGLAKCGTAALPSLRAVLREQCQAADHQKVIEVMTRIGGPGVAQELAEVLQDELTFWKEERPGKDWWQVQDLCLRFGKLGAILDVLANQPPMSCRKTVLELRELWPSIAHSNNNNLEATILRCDRVLQALERPQ